MLPSVAIDVTPHLDAIHALAALYRKELGFGDSEWLQRRLSSVGRRWNVRAAEELDAWESQGGFVSAILPADSGDHLVHPEREDGRGADA